MKCKYCGTDNPADAKFCRHCGKKIGEYGNHPLILRLILAVVVLMALIFSIGVIIISAICFCPGMCFTFDDFWISADAPFPMGRDFTFFPYLINSYFLFIIGCLIIAVIFINKGRIIKYIRSEY